MRAILTTIAVLATAVFALGTPASAASLVMKDSVGSEPTRSDHYVATRLALREEVEKYADDVCALVVIDKMRYPLDPKSAINTIFERTSNCTGRMGMIVNVEPNFLLGSIVPALAEELTPFEIAASGMIYFFEIPSSEEGVKVIIENYCPPERKAWAQDNDTLSFACDQEI